MNDSSVLNDTNNCTNGTCMFMKSEYQDIQAIPKVLIIFISFFFCLIVVVGLFGNLLVVIIVFCNQQMRSTTNILIVNLAMADLIFIVFCAPFTAWEYAQPRYWPFGDTWCRIFQYLVYVSGCASIYALVLMSLGRFLAVVHPVTSRTIRTKRNAYLVIIFTWVVILVSFIPTLVIHGEISEEGKCDFLLAKGYNKAAFQVSLFLTSYVVPLAFIFVVYLLMLKTLWFGVAPGGQSSAKRVRSKKKVTKLVVVIVVIFAICWCPLQIFALLGSLHAYEKNYFKLILRIAAHALAYFNSCVNPILYAFLSEKFRKAFLKVISLSCV